MKNNFFLGILLFLNLTAYATDITFTDTNFKQALLDHTRPVIDTDEDGEISKEEALNVENIIIYGGQGITDISEIGEFINLRNLLIRNATISSIDLSQNLKLEDVSLLSNELSEINVSNNINLTHLKLSYNKLSEIDVSNNTNLIYFEVISNLLTSIDVRNCSLNKLYFNNNPNLIQALLTNQNFSYYDEASGENIKSLQAVGYKNCLNLELLCIDDFYIEEALNNIGQPGYSNYKTSTDCIDSNVYHKLNGKVTYDLNGDGLCDDQDVPFLGELRVSIQPNNGRAFVAIPNDKGEYSLFVPEGNYRSMFPRLNPRTPFQFTQNYAQRNINIPDALDTLITDFCVQPRGAVNDLEINIIPLGRARPGFTSRYLISYRNIGTTTQSPNITLDYQDDVLDYVSSSPVGINTNGRHTWNIGELQPMQTGEIIVDFELNKPTDTPALNSGDFLNYSATINADIDQTPGNNSLLLEEPVVNSYDPNDKTCLEGDILDPDNLGKYLHYLIRFENKGTAEAVNIRVQDVIDTTKLDIETFVPLKGSHSFTTTITNDNEVEFWFNEINLPFDDANNDGYVLFKIKSKSNLVTGDEIVNSAAIYFDFNPPIITEDEIVTVKREVVTLPTFEDYFTLSPNPAESYIELTVLDESIMISEIVFYDIYGYEVGYYSGETRTFNLEHLYPDTYFMKIITDKGELATQFIKL
ncbi:leucine-rich repeat domain-containing protein [Aquimarina sp. RZ0]|uniref:DUF7619 domain-containing protein n=1 Tax=Aquimarina sp. RZ0 TaxID=2607730 RepID=UPI0011F0CF6A|nr:leucine-rich repeat domain-containing protein [Aquimarina sp. RZ0]KAA1244897.1 leucine-rich repeat domain-containing protein [Aquimarina sp. RZ0]